MSALGDLMGQTCCSGGVPISSNLGLPHADQGTFQLGISYDLNTLKTLKFGTEVLDDRTRRRQTHSALLTLGYSFSPRWSIDVLSSFVAQDRRITVNGSIDNDATSGLGDLVILPKFSLINNDKWNWTSGIGVKIATGASDLTDNQGLTIIADLQPGSGATDLIFWNQWVFPISSKPTTKLSGGLTYSVKGTNNEYLGTQAYRFGDELLLNLGVSDQFVISTTIIEPSLILRYRNAQIDVIDGFDLPNTGGQWLFLRPSIAVPLNNGVHTNLAFDVPLIANITGTQLSPTLRVNVSVRFQLSSIKTSN